MHAKVRKCVAAAAPRLRKLIDDTKDRLEVYHRTMHDFNREIHPVLKKSLRRDELLGRINQIVVFLPLNEDEVNLYLEMVQSLITYQFLKIRQVIEKEMKTWQNRAHEKHRIDLSWCSEGTTCKFNKASLILKCLATSRIEPCQRI